MKSETIIVMSTYPSEKDALDTGERVVNLRLAACAQVSSRITSIYHWEGKVCREDEYRLVLKTTGKLEPELTAFLKSCHPYKVAELVTIPFSSISTEYLAWINEVAKP